MGYRRGAKACPAALRQLYVDGTTGRGFHKEQSTTLTLITTTMLNTPTPASAYTATKATKATQLFGLLRHGLTEWNEQKRVQGSMDSPLSNNGQEQTRTWADYLQRHGARDNWQRIIASDLGRVRQTVAILNDRLGLPVHFDTRLREMHWGDWEGRRVKNVREQYGAMIHEQEQLGWDFRPPGGESRKEVLQRVRAALYDSAIKWPEQNILVVCHLGVIKCLINSAVDSPCLPGTVPTLDRNSLQILSWEKGSLHWQQRNIAPEHGT
ncbi:MAG: histidine phosphatase family protein [Desulfopila sp.]